MHTISVTARLGFGGSDIDMTVGGLERDRRVVMSHRNCVALARSKRTVTSVVCRHRALLSS